MMEREGFGTALAAALAPAKSYLRIDGAGEDAAVAALIAAAVSLCEGFTGLMLIERDVTERIEASPEWRRLGATPVTAIAEVAGEGPGGVTIALPAGSFGIDIDARADGWVRATAPGAVRLEVRYRAGLAADWEGLPEGLRQGILRLVAHLYAARDRGGEAAGPPAAVAALWRPWRRMRLQ